MWFWAPDQESADSSHGWLLCPYGQYPASNARKHYQATTALLCQKFDLVFCDCAWWCSSRLWIIYSIFSLSPGSSSGKHGMRVSWEAATVLWNQEVKLNPVSTVVHWWTCAPWMPPVLLSLSFKRVVPSWKKNTLWELFVAFGKFYTITLMTRHPTDISCNYHDCGQTKNVFPALFLSIWFFTVVLSTVKQHLIDKSGMQAKWTWQMEQKS